MSSRSQAWRDIGNLISRLKDVTEATATNAVRLRSNQNAYIYFRANDDGTIDVTPSVKWTNLSTAQAEKIIRALSQIGSS